MQSSEANPENAYRLAIIPARSGSKGIPGKNLRPLAGKPLLAHGIEWALSTKVFQRVLLSTDSEEIARVGLKFGAEAPFLRPPELARDDTPMLPVLLHALRFVMTQGCAPDVIVLLQPTAPFRRACDLVEAMALLNSRPDADSAVSVEQIPDHYSPHYAMRVEGGRLLPFLAEGAGVTRRQDAPPAFTRNGQFYATRRRTLLDKNSIYGDVCLPFVTRHKAVNLDTLDDWAEAERLVATFAVGSA